MKRWWPGCRFHRRSGWPAGAGPLRCRHRRSPSTCRSPSVRPPRPEPAHWRCSSACTSCRRSDSPAAADARRCGNPAPARACRSLFVRRHVQHAPRGGTGQLVHLTRDDAPGPPWRRPARTGPRRRPIPDFRSRCTAVGCRPIATSRCPGYARRGRRCSGGPSDTPVRCRRRRSATPGRCRVRWSARPRGGRPSRPACSGKLDGGPPEGSDVVVVEDRGVGKIAGLPGDHGRSEAASVVGRARRARDRLGRGRRRVGQGRHRADRHIGGRGQGLAQTKSLVEPGHQRSLSLCGGWDAVRETVPRGRRVTGSADRQNGPPLVAAAVAHPDLHRRAVWPYRSPSHPVASSECTRRHLAPRRPGADAERCLVLTCTPIRLLDAAMTDT